MNSITIGYIYGSQNLTDEEELFQKVAKEKNINLIFFNVADKMMLEELEDKIKQCDLVFNNTAGTLAQEIIKMAELMGKKTSSDSKVYYYIEDKWMFFLKCKKAGIPTPETMLLSGNFHAVKKQLVEFNQWPIILKRVTGEQGEFVQKAENYEEAVDIIKNFYEKGNERLPIIGQQYIKSHSYRVTVVGEKIVQTAIKKGYGWKATGMYAEKSEKFDLDEKLIALTKKLIKTCKVDVCGIDYLKKDDQWYALEINSEPSLDFFKEEKETLISEILELLKNKCVISQDKSSEIALSLPSPSPQK